MEKIINKDFDVIIRNHKVMLSAPHAVNQIRNGKIKKYEEKTRKIVERVARNTDSCCIYKTKCLEDDANYDEYSYYRKYCSNVVKKERIKAFLDIHGMSSKRAQDICISINDGNNINHRQDILEHVIAIFKNDGFANVTIDTPFSATRKSCVSTYIHNECNIIAFQIEINYKYRSKKYKEYDLDGIITTLSKIVKYLDLCIE